MINLTYLHKVAKRYVKQVITLELPYLAPLTSAHRGGYNGGSPQKFEGELSKIFQALYSLRYLRGMYGY